MAEPPRLPSRAAPASARETARGSGGDVAEPPTISSRSLFGDAAEVRIDHAGVVYRLKRTALGKLILTK